MSLKFYKFNISKHYFHILDFNERKIRQIIVIKVLGMTQTWMEPAIFHVEDGCLLPGT